MIARYAEIYPLPVQNSGKCERALVSVLPVDNNPEITG
jgi:hypothetical protein